MSCWASRGRGREKGRASLSSAGSSAGTLPQRGWPGSRLPSRGSTLRGVSVGGQSRRNWVSSASSESSFRKRLIWGGKGVRKEGTPAAAPLSIGTPKPPQPASCTPKAGAGENLGKKKKRGTTVAAPGQAWGEHGDSRVRAPRGAGAYSLLHGEVGRLLALRGAGMGTVPPGPAGGLGTPTLLGVFWGGQSPRMRHGLQGAWGRKEGGEKRDERQQPRSWGANRGLLVGSPWKLPWESQPTGGLPDWGQG